VTIEILIATGNRHKLKEIREMLVGTRFTAIGLDDVPDAPAVVEDADSFRGNAEKKARTLALLTGRLTVAGDSGFVVAVLDGAPGIYSARFAGVDGPGADEANNDLLLQRLAGVPDHARTARFRCALAVVTADGRIRYADGTVEGRIGHERRGTNGFGYDPLFLLDGDPSGRTTAELPSAEKHAISHRGHALRRLLPILEELSRKT
jgi:XTP/dITP diphosphohydrolase